MRGLYSSAFVLTLLDAIAAQLQGSNVVPFRRARISLTCPGGVPMGIISSNGRNVPTCDANVAPAAFFFDNQFNHASGTSNIPLSDLKAYGALGVVAYGSSLSGTGLYMSTFYEFGGGQDPEGIQSVYFTDYTAGENARYLTIDQSFLFYQQANGQYKIQSVQRNQEQLYDGPDSGYWQVNPENNQIISPVAFSAGNGLFDISLAPANADFPSVPAQDLTPAQQPSQYGQFRLSLPDLDAFVGYADGVYVPSQTAVTFEFRASDLRPGQYTLFDTTNARFALVTANGLESSELEVDNLTNFLVIPFGSGTFSLYSQFNGGHFLTRQASGIPGRKRQSTGLFTPTGEDVEPDGGAFVAVPVESAATTTTSLPVSTAASTTEAESTTVSPESTTDSATATMASDSEISTTTAAVTSEADVPMSTSSMIEEALPTTTAEDGTSTVVEATSTATDGSLSTSSVDLSTSVATESTSLVAEEALSTSTTELVTTSASTEDMSTMATPSIEPTSSSPSESDPNATNISEASSSATDVTTSSSELPIESIMPTSLETIEPVSVATTLSTESTSTFDQIPSLTSSIEAMATSSDETVPSSTVEEIAPSATADAPSSQFESNVGSSSITATVSEAELPAATPSVSPEASSTTVSQSADPSTSVNDAVESSSAFPDVPSSMLVTTIETSAIFAESSMASVEDVTTSSSTFSASAIATESSFPSQAETSTTLASLPSSTASPVLESEPTPSVQLSSDVATTSSALFPSSTTVSPVETMTISSSAVSDAFSSALDAPQPTTSPDVAPTTVVENTPAQTTTTTVSSIDTVPDSAAEPLPTSSSVVAEAEVLSTTLLIATNSVEIPVTSSQPTFPLQTTTEADESTIIVPGQSTVAPSSTVVVDTTQVSADATTSSVVQVESTSLSTESSTSDQASTNNPTSSVELPQTASPAEPTSVVDQPQEQITSSSADGSAQPSATSMPVSEMDKVFVLSTEPDPVTNVVSAFVCEGVKFLFRTLQPNESPSLISFSSDGTLSCGGNMAALQMTGSFFTVDLIPAGSPTADYTRVFFTIEDGRLVPSLDSLVLSKRAPVTYVTGVDANNNVLVSEQGNTDPAIESIPQVKAQDVTPAAPSSTTTPETGIPTEQPSVLVSASAPVTVVTTDTGSLVSQATSTVLLSSSEPILTTVESASASASGPPPSMTVSQSTAAGPISMSAIDFSNTLSTSNTGPEAGPTSVTQPMPTLSMTEIMSTAAVADITDSSTLLVGPESPAATLVPAASTVITTAPTQGASGATLAVPTITSAAPMQPPADSAIVALQLRSFGLPLICQDSQIAVSPDATASPSIITIDQAGVLSCGDGTVAFIKSQGNSSSVYAVRLLPLALPEPQSQLGIFAFDQQTSSITVTILLASRKRQMPMTFPVGVVNGVLVAGPNVQNMGLTIVVVPQSQPTLTVVPVIVSVPLATVSISAPVAVIPSVSVVASLSTSPVGAPVQIPTVPVTSLTTLAQLPSTTIVTGTAGSNGIAPLGITTTSTATVTVTRGAAVETVAIVQVIVQSPTAGSQSLAPAFVDILVNNVVVQVSIAGVPNFSSSLQTIGSGAASQTVSAIVNVIIVVAPIAFVSAGVTVTRLTTVQGFVTHVPGNAVAGGLTVTQSQGPFVTVTATQIVTMPTSL